MHAITIDNVVKRFGNFTAVDGISLNVAKGSVHGFLGPNGAGKTTTIRMMMNIIKPDQGSIRVLGEEVGEQIKSKVGYLPEERGVYKKMKVVDLITYFGSLKGVPVSEGKKKALRMLEELGLGEWGNRACQDLSKGMQQKVQFIATILHDPELVILDEPFSGLDPVNTEVIRDKVLELRRNGTTVLFSTHIMDQAEKLCDAVVLINHGKKVVDGSLHQVKTSAVAEEAILLDYDGSGDAIRSFPMVEHCNDHGKSMEVFLRNGEDPQEFLKQAAGVLRVRRFEVRTPTLHEIFVRSVQGDGTGVDPRHAAVRVKS